MLPPAPRFLDLQEFVCEAAACGATVLLAAHDTLTATGQLQVNKGGCVGVVWVCWERWGGTFVIGAVEGGR